MKASEIYKKQNIAIHKAFGIIGMPYGDYEDTWRELFSQIAKREITSMTELTLGQRRELIDNLKSKNVKVFNPFVPKHFHGWRKGDEEKVSSGSGRPLPVPENKKRYIGKINALILDMSLSWNYADGIAKKLSGIEKVEWCDPDQLQKIIAALVYKQQRQKRRSHG